MLRLTEDSMKRLALLALMSLLPAGAAAQTLVLGLSADVTSIDPHFHNTSSNNAASRHVFETLVRQDSRQRLVPGLAVAWRVLDDGLTWEFELRPDVRFHDGAPFTAEDVVASLRRPAALQGSPSSFSIYTRAVATASALGPLRLRLTTAQPYPLLPNDLSLVPIVAARFAERPTASFNAGEAAIGTGPYRFRGWTPGERILRERHDRHWEGRPSWEQVELRLIRNAPARTAALLAGDVQAIESPPPDALDALRPRDDVAISSVPSNRVMFLFPDVGRSPTPFVTDRSGAPLAPNPLRDPRVRRALSLAIDRQALVTHVLNGEGAAAGQVVPAGFFGAAPDLRPDPFDPEAAAAELRAAGLADRLAVTLHGPNDRFVRDGAVLQAIAPMLQRIGVQAQVEVMPWSVFATRSSRPEFSLILVGWGAGTGEASSPLRGLLATFNPAAGLGASNRGRYSNPAFDALLDQAFRTVRDEEREGLLRRATLLAVGEDRGLIPLYFEMASWAHRRSVTHTPRVDQYTLAMDFLPAR